MVEEWKTIEDHPRYEVSNAGKIRNKITGRIYDGTINKSGYREVCISESGKRKILFNHREVAKAFIPKIEGKEFVNHKDGDKANSNLSNLEWCTPRENAIHSFRVLGNEAKNKRPVLCIETGKKYDSCLGAAKAINGSDGAIVRCCQGKKKHHHGYSWKYVV